MATDGIVLGILNYCIILFFALLVFNYKYPKVAALEAPHCYSVHDKLGECVSFDLCPPLKKLLRPSSGVVTVDSLRILQRLTCGFVRDEPKICCPVTEIVRVSSQGSWDIPGFQTNSQDKLKPPAAESGIQSQSQSPKFPHTPPELESETSSQPPGQFLDYRSHKSFGLVPGLKDCSNAVNSARIVGGKETGLAAYPWMIRIGYKNEETQEIEFYCGGTIINKRYILTAAHCTEEIDEGFTPVVIRVGEYDTTTEEDCSPNLGCAKYADYKIEKLIPHSSYNTEDKTNDIELIRVSEDISFESFAVRPVCLPFHNEYGISDVWEKQFSEKGEQKVKGFVAGWGRTKWNNAEGSDVLLEVQLPLISNEECQYNYSSRVQISDKQMCAGGIRQKDSCGGDSGGPLLVPVTVKGEGKFFQVGVVSFGPVQCGLAGLPGVYSRISFYLPWILDNIRP